MPNWVSNSVSITAENKADLDAFLEKAKGGQSKIIQDTNEFHFGAFIHPSDEDLPYYKGEVEEDKPEGYENWTTEEQFAYTYKMKFAGRDWYDWNVREWGTKWDSCDTDVNRLDDLKASITFQTAWSIPEPVLRAMVEQHPELTFSIWAEEEQGWGAEFVGANGSLVVTEEWDIPNSHADYARRDNEENCICGYEDDRTEWYDDCPGKQKIFVRVTKVYELEASDLEEARTEFFQMDTGVLPYPEELSDYGSIEFIDEDGKQIEENK